MSEHGSGRRVAVTFTPQQVTDIVAALTAAVELSEEQDEDMAKAASVYPPEDIREARAFTEILRVTLATFNERLSVAEHYH